MSANHEKVEALFHEALKFKPAERPAFLAGACGSDTELRRQLEVLLQAEAEAGGFLPETPEPMAPTVVPITEKAGDQIGHYKLLQKVGEGGCGVVYMAEQEEPVRRRVALKVIKLGMDTKSVVARFEAERQALADLQSRLGGALCVLAFTDPALTSVTREPKLTEAETLLQQGPAALEQDPKSESKYQRDALERLVRLYEAWEKPEKLAEWKQKLAAFENAEAKKNKLAQP